MDKKNNNSREIAIFLISSKNKILDYLKKVIENKDFNYRTFGTSIEEHLAAIILNLLKENGFIKIESDYVVAVDKNHFPDFELKKILLAVEFKSGNESQIRDGKWIKVKNSENDMGTLNMWPSKIAKFGGENIYYIFVFYNFNNNEKKIVDLEIAPFYRFIGTACKGKVLKYREKDGNLRPKDFYIESPIKTFEQFEKLFYKTVIYRSKRIIKKHRLIIKEALKKL